MIRRTLLLASMVVLFWAGPAHAQYGGILGEGGGRGTGVTVPGGQGAGGQGSGAGNRRGADFAKTGPSNAVPLIQAAVVLLGGGLLLVLVGRRRHAARRHAAA